MVLDALASMSGRVLITVTNPSADGRSTGWPSIDTSSAGVVLTMMRRIVVDRDALLLLVDRRCGQRGFELVERHALGPGNGVLKRCRVRETVIGQRREAPLRQA